MRTMPTILRDLIFGVALSTIIFLGARAWGYPFIAMAAQVPVQQGQQAHPQQSAPQQPAKSTTFTGTVVRNGEQFVLRDSSGAFYRLDDPQHAQPFEGKAVKVTGRLDAEAKTIHVDKIEAA
jgi:hypothetical protein